MYVHVTRVRIPKKTSEVEPFCSTYMIYFDNYVHRMLYVYFCIIDAVPSKLISLFSI